MRYVKGLHTPNLPVVFLYVVSGGVCARACARVRALPKRVGGCVAKELWGCCQKKKNSGGVAKRYCEEACIKKNGIIKRGLVERCH